LTINAEGDFNNNVYIAKGIKDTNATVLRGLSLVVVSNLNNVVLPVGYKLIQNKENETVNLAPKGTKDYFVFLAYSD
jgi:hypothetical protein